MYYSMCQGVIIVCDLTRADSLETIKTWTRSVLMATQTPLSLFLVGNKADDTLRRAIPFPLALKAAQTYHLHYLEVSAKTGEGIGELVEKIACQVLGTSGIVSNSFNGIDATPQAACHKSKNV